MPTSEAMITLSLQRAAVLHADAENYTGRMAGDPHGTVRAVRHCRSLFGRLVARHGGRIVNRSGDSVLAIFDHPDQAVVAALAIQDRLAEPMGRASDITPLPFRIGLDLGEVMITGRQVYGDLVNRAARIQEAAEPGEVLVSEGVRASLPSDSGEIVFSDEGIQRLRGLPRPMRLFRAARPDRPASGAGRRRSLPRLGLPNQPSLVVLPLRQTGAASQDDYLADGLTDELIANLSRFRQLFVIGRASSFVYKGRRTDPTSIGQELGVRYVVSGTVQVSGDRIRLAIQLVDTSGEQLLWAERFDYPARDLFGLEEELGRLLVVTLIGEVERHGLRRSLAKPEDGVVAHDCIMRGLHELYRYTPTANASARFSFEQAVAMDPSNARAHALLSRAHNYDWRYRWSNDPAVSFERSAELARRAVELDPWDASGHAELAWVHLYRKQLEASLAAYETARRINPNDPDILALMADAVAYAGDPSRALELVGQAKRLNPHFPDLYLWSEADALFSLRRYREVIACIGQMRDPGEGCRLLAASWAHLGEQAEAERHAQLVLRRQPNFRVEDWIAIQPEADLAELEHFGSGLRKAGLR